MICPFFGVCGGCAYQDLPPEKYRKLKLNFIHEALSRQCIDFPLEKLIEIGPHTRRRATFALENGHFGFNAKKSHQIIDITSCLVLMPEIEILIVKLRNLLKNFSSNADVAVLMTPFGADITLISKKEQKKRFIKNKKSYQIPLLFIEQVASFCTQNNIARFVCDSDILYQKVQLPFPSNVFMQPSEKGEKALIDLVLEGCKDNTRVVDLFCGLGTFTIPLQRAGKKVKGFDITYEAIESLKKSGIEAYTRDLFRQPLTPEELNAFDCAVLDPARAGAAAQVEQIAQSNLKNVVMVSCNPLTFAKDCKILAQAGFEFVKITPVDQFTYTEHVEVVAYLKRK